MRERRASHRSPFQWVTAALISGVLLAGGCGLDEDTTTGVRVDQTELLSQADEPVVRSTATGLEAFPAATLGALQWVRGDIPSCDNACSSAGQTAVSSGTYINGETFYVCAANAHGEGFRGGYNLRPSWANACIVGWGGREEATRPYWCLCH